MTENAQRILQQAFGDAVYACPLPDLSQSITDFIANRLPPASHPLGDLSRFSAAPSSHLSGYPFESQGAFPA